MGSSCLRSVWGASAVEWGMVGRSLISDCLAWKLAPILIALFNQGGRQLSLPKLCTILVRVSFA